MTPTIPTTFLAVEPVNYNSPGNGYDPTMLDLLPRIPAMYAELGFGGVWGWNMGGHHFDQSKPPTEFNRTMLPTSPDADIPEKVLWFYENARNLGMRTGWHEGDVSQIVYGDIPTEKRVWTSRDHYAQMQKRIATIRSFRPDFTSLDNCGNLAGMRDVDGNGWKETPEIDDTTYKAKYPRQEGIVTDVVQLFIGGLPNSRVIVEPSYRPVECWWKKRLPPNIPAMQQVDIDLKRTHTPSKGFVSPDEFLILASIPQPWNMQVLRRFIGECHSQGSHAIIKKHHIDAALRASGHTVPGGG